MPSWTNASQSSAPSWVNTEDTILDPGNPIGLLLSLTYTVQSYTVSWTNASQSSAPSWTNVTAN